MRLGALVLALALCAGCDRAPTRPPPDAPPATLFQRVGGIAVLRAVVDELASRVAADPALAPVYATTDFAAYKKRLLVELCGVTGGPCRAPAAPAAPPGVAAPVAAAWVAHLVEAATATGVPGALRDELVREVEPRAAELARGDPGQG